ncbi:carboxymuconolactone decarboxylase family protein [Pedobacter heparinus]|uniref:carboxymuconolactone decarboxylase family protein n=1 Tax=Pedobacter heparinus TaxID=984 RepID=UPI0029305B64|nr:carboxymuconolactone decarboxylase family protein [Pedobacter heparinus]
MNVRHSIIKWALCLLLIISIKTMNAQIETNSSAPLNGAQQSLVAISSLTATGDMANLKIQLNTALDAGLTVNEIKEVLVQLYAYCGFPRSLNAINVFMKVVEERKSEGVNDKQGKEIIVERGAGDNYERGRKVLETLSGAAQAKPAPGFGVFAPRIDAFLKEHLFADVFQSDVLTHQQRELVTISALAAMPGVESQLQSHVKMGMNTVITNEQLVEVAKLIEKHVSRKQANSLRNVLSIPTAPVIDEEMMVRISEIEILPEYLSAYSAILKEEASASVKLEPGVIAIFPMFQKETPTQIRIIEMYANKAAYQSHLKTPHFLHYKTTTLKMVKTLKLVDMGSMDEENMEEIFKKLN